MISANYNLLYTVPYNTNHTYFIISSQVHPTQPPASGNGNSMKQSNEAEEFIAWPP